MKKFLGTVTLLLALSLPGLAQGQTRLSADDQKEFDKYYTKWVNDTRKNDRDDIAKDVHKMQQIMGRYNIQANVPFEQIASGGPAVRVYQGRLSADDQREFDKYYTKWVNDTRKNDRDDISKDVGRMQQIMAKNNIPASVPFDQIASTGYPGNGYPAAAYPTTNSQWQSRLSPDDQRDFDRYYSKWVDDMRKNDRDDVGKDAGYMQEIMARNNIPASVPFDQIASSAAYSSGSSPTYVQRLSVDDQREFDHHYAEWLEHTRKNDRDDVAKDVSHMQEIMARNNIPANVPFDRIASPDAARH